MTNRFRKSSSKSFATTKYNASQRKHRRRKLQDDSYDGDCIGVTRSDQSPNDSEFDQPPPNDDEEYDSSYVASSDSVTDDHQFSSQADSRTVSDDDRTNYNILKTTAASLSSESNTRKNGPRPSSRNSSFMSIAPFPTFRGASDECPNTHLSRFAKVCRANNVSSIDMMTRIFPVTLEDEAALWYDLNIEPYSASLTWEEIKSSFSHAYSRIVLTDQLRSQLITINQGNDESVRSYFLRLQWILKKWPEHGLSENLLKWVFIDGLKKDFQDWITPQKPSSLNEALRLAFSFEQVRSVRDVRRNVPMKCGFCDGLHEERGCEVRERMRELTLQSKEQGSLVDLEKKISSTANREKKFERSASMVASSSTVVGKNGVEDGKEENDLGLKKKSHSHSQSQSQCQCGKHQCWKRKLERNFSNVSGN